MFVDDSDDERDSFDVERRQTEIFQRKFLSTTFQSSSSSDDDDEGIIDGTKIPSSSKAKRRAKHSFLDISICSSTNSNDDEIEMNPFEILPVTTKATIRKPTKNEIIETERKMQQLSRSEQLVLPTFVPKSLQNFQQLEKRTKPTTTESTLIELTKLIDENKLEKKIDRLSRFLNAEILNKKPTIGQMKSSTIDLTETKKTPTVKTPVQISSTKKLFEMQNLLEMRMKEKRAATLAENPTNFPDEDEEEIEEIQDDSMSTNSETESQAELLSTVEREPVLPMDEETRDFISDDEEFIDEKTDVSNPPSDPNRPSLKTILNRMESLSEPPVTNGQTEWFAASEPVPMDKNLELLCSGTFGDENIIPLSQNYNQGAPMAFSPLPPTQFDNDEEEDLEPRTKTKVRQLIDDDDDQDDHDGDQDNQDDDQEEEEEEEDNEELVDYKKQLFEMEAEESGSENEEKRPNDDEENESDEDDEQPDEELAKFIDTDAVELDENELDSMAKVHLKLKAKEDEHQLKLLKEQYLDFDGDDDGRRIQIGRGTNDDDEEEEEDPDFQSGEEEDEEDEQEEEEEDPLKFKDRFSELERQRSLQDNQAEQLHLDEDLENIGQKSSMFKKGLALKQKKIQNVPMTNVQSETKSSRSMTLSSVLLAQRFSSTLLGSVNKLNPLHPNPSANSTETKKQHNPRRHVFATNTTHSNAQENQNPLPSTTSAVGEKRANSSEKSPSMKTKRFKKSTNNIATTIKSTELSSSSVFSALALSTHRH